MRSTAGMAVLAVGLVCAAFSRAQAQSASAALRPSAPAAAAIHLRAGDAVRVEIADEPDLTGDFVIGTDGDVLLPIIGVVRVVNRGFDEVASEMRSRYAKEFTNIATRFTPLLRIAVLGEVRQPGLYLVDPTYTLDDLLAKAGGLTASGNPRRVNLVSADGKRSVRMNVGEGQDVMLVSGDQVRVGDRGFLRENAGVLVGAAGSLAVALITGVLLR